MQFNFFHQIVKKVFFFVKEKDKMTVLISLSRSCQQQVFIALFTLSVSISKLSQSDCDIRNRTEQVFIEHLNYSMGTRLKTQLGTSREHKLSLFVIVNELLCEVKHIKKVRHSLNC